MAIVTKELNGTFSKAIVIKDGLLLTYRIPFAMLDEIDSIAKDGGFLIYKDAFDHTVRVSRTEDAKNMVFSKLGGEKLTKVKAAFLSTIINECKEGK